ncbi:MAG: addiction module protein [Desulfobacterales bacterium]
MKHILSVGGVARNQAVAISIFLLLLFGLKEQRKKMLKQLEEIINVAMELSLEERAQLAGTLLSILDEPSKSEVERLWLQEAERRLQEFREGKVKGIPAEEVFNLAIADIS